jgi:hypothetical protein
MNDFYCHPTRYLLARFLKVDRLAKAGPMDFLLATGAGASSKR